MIVIGHVCQYHWSERLVYRPNVSFKSITVSGEDVLAELQCDHHVHLRLMPLKYDCSCNNTVAISIPYVIIRIEFVLATTHTIPSRSVRLHLLRVSLSFNEGWCDPNLVALVRTQPNRIDVVWIYCANRFLQCPCVCVL